MTAIVILNVIGATLIVTAIVSLLACAILAPRGAARTADTSARLKSARPARQPGAAASARAPRFVPTAGARA